MNILQVNTLDIRGGAARVAYELHQTLNQSDHDSAKYLVRKKYSTDPDVAALESTPSHLQPILTKLSEVTRRDWTSSYRNLTNLIHRQRANDVSGYNSDQILDHPWFSQADLVQLHNLHGNYFSLDTLLALQQKKPLVWTLHDLWPITAHCAYTFEALKPNGFYQCRDLLDPPSLAWNNRRQLETIKAQVYQHLKVHLVSPSQWLTDKVSASVLKNSPLTIIPNGIDTQVFTPTKNKSRLRQKLNLDPNKVIIGCAAYGGDKSYWKGGEYLTATSQAMTSNAVQFLSIGGTNTGEIIGTGHLDEASMVADFMGACDMFIHTARAENFPLVILEAMACGLPITSFEVGGIPEQIVKGKSGYTIKPYDTKSFIQALTLLCHDEPKRRSFGHFNRQRAVAYFDKKLMYQRYQQLYQSLIES